MTQIQRLNGNAVGLVPSVNGNFSWAECEPAGNHDIFLVTGGQRTERKFFQGYGALLTNDFVVLFENRNRDHQWSWRDGGRRQFHDGVGINVIHHFARRQTAVERIRDLLRGEWSHRRQEIILV